MGAGASAQQEEVVLPDTLDEPSVRALAGDRFDAAKFAELAVDGKITKELLLHVGAEQDGEGVAQLFALGSVQICVLQPPQHPEELVAGKLQIISTTSGGVEYILLQLGDSFLYPLAGQEVVLCEDQALSLVLPDLEVDGRFFGLTPSDSGGAWEDLIRLVGRDCALSRSSDAPPTAGKVAPEGKNTFQAADAVAQGVEASSAMVAGAVLSAATGLGAGMVRASKCVVEKQWMGKPTKEPVQISEKTKGRIAVAKRASEGAKVRRGGLRGGRRGEARRSEEKRGERRDLATTTHHSLPPPPHPSPLFLSSLPLLSSSPLFLSSLPLGACRGCRWGWVNSGG
jgi:hypothetical protein